MGIEEVPISARSPWQNPYVERVIGSIRRECLDHVIVFSERHLRRVLRGYLEYYHGSRTHLGLEKDCPVPRGIEPPDVGTGSAKSRWLAGSITGTFAERRDRHHLPIHLMSTAAVSRWLARSKSPLAFGAPLDYHQVREIMAGEGWLDGRSSGGWSLHGWTPGSFCEPNPCVSGVDDEAQSIALSLTATPNPSTGQVMIRYTLPKPTTVTIEVFDAAGALVRRLAEGQRPAGAFSTPWDGRDDAGHDLPTGVYFVRLVTGQGSAMGRAVIAR